MAIVEHKIPLTQFLNNKMAPDQFAQEVHNLSALGALSRALVGAPYSDFQDAILNFSGSLDGQDLIELDNLAAAHTGEGITIQEEVSVKPSFSESEKKLIVLSDQLSVSFGANANVTFHADGEDLNIFSIEVWTGGVSSYGDRIDFEIVDIDDVKGGGAGAVIRDLGKDVYVPEGGYPHPGYKVETGTVIRVESGLYFRVTYYNGQASGDANMVVSIKNFKS